MPATMKKANRQYECDDLNTIDWGRIKTCTGKAIPGLAKKEVNDIIKQTAKGKYKAPYAKLGLVNGDMVLRVKDGSKHLSDIILATAADLAGGAAAAPTLSATDQRSVDAYRQAKDNLPVQTKVFVGRFRTALTTAKNKLNDLKDFVNPVMKLAVPPEQAARELQRASDRLQELRDMETDLTDTLRDDVKVALMDPHRNGPWASCPAAATGELRKELITNAGKCWTTANSHYSQMEGIIKQVNSMVKLGDGFLEKAQNVANQTSSKRDAALASLGKVATNLRKDLDDVTSIYENNANSSRRFLDFVNNKYAAASAKDATLDMKHSLIEQVINQSKLLSGRTKDIHSTVATIQREATEAATGLEKSQQKDNDFKPLIKLLVEIKKEAEKLKKKWDDDLTAGLKKYQDMKKLVAT